MDTEKNLFDKFGGTRQMARTIDRAPSTVNSWRTVGRIPGDEQRRIITLAAQHGIKLTADDVVWPLGRQEAKAA